MKKIVSLLCVIILTMSCSKTKQTKSHDTIDVKIAHLLQQMTLKEKVGQMLNLGLPSLLKGNYWDQRDSAVFDSEKFKKFVVDYGVGSIHNTAGYLSDREDWYRMVKTIQDSAIANTRLGIPILYGIDNIHGANYVKGSVMFPHQIAIAATWNPELSKSCGKITSYESRAASLPWNFNPNADVAASPLWGRIAESFGEDPYLIAQMTNAYTLGSQENGLLDSVSTAVCIKHYLGYGAGTNGKDRANAIIPENNLRQYFLPPFEEAIKNGAMSIMISSNAINGIPCHSNKYYITDILKGELDFKGVVISDFSDVEFLIKAHETASDMIDATKQAVNAGLDVLMNPYDADIVDIIIDLVEKNEIPISRIDDAVTRVLRLKYQLNLFEVPYSNPDNYSDFGSEKHIEANYQSAAEAITLLKNKEAVLPLPKKARVLVTGYAANSMNILNGAWSRTFLGTDNKYNDPSKLTIYEAIKAQVGSTNVDYIAGTDYLKDINTKEAIKKAKYVDYIVVCVGEIPATEKPSDIDELDLPQVQQDLVRKLAIYNKPIILVMVQGRPRIIRDIEPLSNAILMAYLPGQEGGRAISDVLFGKINPSGKLPYTYPKFTGNTLPYYHKKTDIRDVNWGFDGFYPQYEFGYGLSYTTFKYSDLTLSKDTISNNESLTISVQVKNTGEVDGKEVVEVFLKDIVASVSPDAKKLVRFNKVSLRAKEETKITFKINAADLKMIGIKNDWIVEVGDFELQVGGNPQEMEKINFYYKD